MGAESSEMQLGLVSPQPSPRHTSVCALVSGGLDSCILVCELTKTYEQVHPVYVRAGLIWEEAELSSLRRFLTAVHSKPLQPLTELALPAEDLYGDHWSASGEAVPDGRSEDEAVYLPGRNLLLLAKAGLFCALNGIPAIALAVLATNPFPDATDEFYQSMGASLSLGLAHPMVVLRPFGHLHKKEVMDLGRNLPLELTFSCINPQDGGHCGDCNKCAERIAAFRAAGIEDRTVYAEPVGEIFSR